MTETSPGKDLIAEARNKLDAAIQAHKAGDARMRDMLLRQAAVRFHAAGRDDMAVHCQKLAGKPA
jgi:hypothetical protein